MSLYRCIWRAAGTRQLLVFLSPSASPLLQPRSGRAPSVCRCWVQPLFTDRRLSQKLKPRTSLQAKSEQAPPLTAAQKDCMRLEIPQNLPEMVMKTIPNSAKLKRAGADVTYMIVAIIGLGITGGLLYILYSELVSSSSPYKIYTNAFDKCRNHPEVIAAFGEPLNAFGETTRRGRRQHVASTKYFKDGFQHIRLKFYLSGSEPKLQGVVYVELRENPETGKFDFQYIIVEMDSIPRRSIVVEDNRHMD